MSNEKDLNHVTRFSVKLSADSVKPNGDISGVAYTGAVIEEHGFIRNLVIDLSTLSVKKKITPLFRDHNPSQVVGKSEVVVSDKDVTFSGKLFNTSQYGKEIIDLASEGLEWEVSLGVYGGKLQEVEEEEVNGHFIQSGTALRNGVIREVSIVALGADDQTSAEIFKVQKGENKMKYNFTEEQWQKFACACGGDKDSSSEDLEKKFAESDDKAAELQKEIDAKQAEIDALKAQIEELKGKEETAARVEKINAAVKAKGIEMSAAKIDDAAKTEASTTLLLSFIEDMKAEKKIPSGMAGKQDLGNAVKGNVQDIHKQAELMVKEGKAKNLFEAITMLEVK